jgi:hypothetical protein
MAGARLRGAEPRRERDDRRRIEPAAQARAHVDVAAQAQADGILQQGPHLAGISGALDRLRQAVPGPDGEGAVVEADGEAVPAGQRADVLEERALGLVEGAVDEERAHGRVADAGADAVVGEKALDLRGEGEDPVPLPVVEGLDAEAVPRAEDGAAGRVVEERTTTCR